MLESEDHDFDCERYAFSKKCSVDTCEDILHEFQTHWYPDWGVVTHSHNAWLKVKWKKHQFELLRITTAGFHCMNHRSYLLGPDRKTSEAFFEEVCRWNSEVHGEILVFSDGHWEKDQDLFKSIKSSSLENLILAGDLKNQIVSDTENFFRHRDRYEKHKIPWKRGVLFLGPPGNGKTHMVKALANSLDVPCLYVRTFNAEYQTPENCIMTVFERARSSAPCLLVIEDLDAVIDDSNRSFFLNEMDGFYDNKGILTLATTNHPERLDPAILDRPSRFDRKYGFELPKLAERVAYSSMVNRGLEDALRLNDAEVALVAEATEGFSFAYLKELFLSAMMEWINHQGTASMMDIALGQVEALRTQMVTEPEAAQPRQDRKRAAYIAFGACKEE